MRVCYSIILLLSATMIFTSCGTSPTTTVNQVIETGKLAEARDFFVNKYWNKRFTKCEDGWYKSRINTKEYYLRMAGPTTGYLAVKGEPKDWKFEVATPSEADRLRGVTWFADVAMTPSVSIAYTANVPSGGIWESYRDGWNALWLAGFATSYYTPREGDIGEEGPTIYMQVYHNEKVEESWGIIVSNGRYVEGADVLIKSWLIDGATAADCAKFPKMP